MVYQPEIEKWDGFTFQARFAVSVQDASQPAPTFGVIWVTANSNVDKDAGMVTLTNMKITKTNFPTEPNNAQKYAAYLTSQIPAQSLPIPLSQNRQQIPARPVAQESRRAAGQEHAAPDHFQQ